MKWLIAVLILAAVACGQPLAVVTPFPTAAAAQADTAYDVVMSESPALEEWEVCAETLYVRGGYGTGWSVQDVKYRGDIVHVREWSPTGNGWAMIEAARWVNADYLAKVGQCE